MPTVDFRCYLISDRAHTHGRALIAALQAAAHAGVRVMQLREKDLTPRELYALAEEAREALQPLGVRLLVNDRADIACAAGLEGVHLTTTSLTPLAARKCLRVGSLLGVSTHTLTEARFAEASGADFITFGPVFMTPSKAAYGDPRGLDALREVCAAVAIPVFTLGGVTPARVPACLEAGAHGVAAISALLDTPDIAAAVADFRAALGEL
jgi:thiamine-phosphate pyrophosphorylase